MRHRKLRATFGKNAIKHASTLVANTGPGVGSFFAHVIYETTVGGRLSSGGIQTIKDTATTERDINIGDVVKYVNICIECSPRGVDSTNIKDDAGWLEWAVVWQRERSIPPTVANIGVLTLGVVASHFYRENCFLTGCFPVGSRQSMVQDLKIKLPDRCCKIKIGDSLTLFAFLRGSSSTDTRTDSNRLIVSSHFKVYS